ncbi:CLUMA_CG000556, isoform A [Clunio marinus]|uniref:CLUMA_CG000556, isoform A n=1 Tax=Clunio marinus TaxID=568069 RepID=A0A1J1HFU0_9DIPT|nr:CLUMA_CG000556, isoform A [Clunio marinus]
MNNATDFGHSFISLKGPSEEGKKGLQRHQPNILNSNPKVTTLEKATWADEKPNFSSSLTSGNVKRLFVTSSPAFLCHLATRDDGEAKIEILHRHHQANISNSIFKLNIFSFWLITQTFSVAFICFRSQHRKELSESFFHSGVVPG